MAMIRAKGSVSIKRGRGPTIDIPSKHIRTVQQGIVNYSGESKKYKESVFIPIHALPNTNEHRLGSDHSSQASIQPHQTWWPVVQVTWSDEAIEEYGLGLGVVGSTGQVIWCICLYQLTWQQIAAWMIELAPYMGPAVPMPQPDAGVWGEPQD
jgi:hypothetical protein